MKEIKRHFVKRLMLCCVAFSLVSVSVFSQPNVNAESISKSLPSGSITISEKLYVHTDKSFYLPGEILWFKVYCVDAVTNRPLDVSKVVYVEILDKEHKAVLQAKIAMNEGGGNGSFMIPSSINSNGYILRAYTNWMKNFDADYFFEKQIIIVNGLKRPDWQTLQKGENFDVQFFPEGGNLVNGIRSKVAFRAVDETGKGIACRGYIINQNNDTVTTFKPLHFGIGNFYITPAASDHYRAVLRLPDDKLINAKLPEALPSGFVMALKDSAKEIITVTVSANTSASANKVYLVAHRRQHPYAILEKEMINGTGKFILNKDMFDEGTTTLTILNGDHQPVCERLYFKRPEKKMLVDIKPDRPEYRLRTKVNLNLLTHRQEKTSATGNFSMSVYLLDSLQNIDQTNISTYLFLTSELKGNIESPGYYLSNAGSVTNEAIDNLMLTHGWRKLSDNKILNNNAAFEFAPEYEGSIVTGRITDKASGNPVGNVLTHLSLPGQRYQYSNAVSDKHGLLSFVVKNNYGNNEMILQTNNRADSSYRINISNPYSQSFSNTIPYFDLKEKWKDQLTSRNLHVQVQSAFDNDKVQRFSIPQQLDSTQFFGIPDKKYLLDDYTRFPTMEEVLREYVAEVRLRKQGSDYHISVHNLPYQENFDTDPFILIDGVPVFDINKLISFDPLKIRKLEVIAKKFYTGNTVNNGILSFSTYEGKLADYDPGQEVLITEFEGLQMNREFFSPVYDTMENQENPMPDARNVLYWSPDIKTDPQGNADISFYTSDVPGTYAIAIEGINEEGATASSLKIISVVK